MGNIRREIVAALDLGANFFRMIIAEINSDGKIRILEDLQKNTSLGKDTFSKGRISAETIYETCDILDGFVKLMKDYGVKFYWAVSTSGIREAENREYVLEQIRVKTGILIEVINTSQERFLVFKALRDKIENSSEFYNEGAMILNIGSGGIEVSVYSEGSLKFTEYIKIGSLRLREILGRLENKTLNFSEIMTEFVESKIYTLREQLKAYKVKNFVGLGGSFKFLLKLYSSEERYISKESFLDFFNKIKNMTTEKICEKFDINKDEAKLLLPSTIILMTFLNMTLAEKVHVPRISLRHGMLIDMLSKKLDTSKKRMFDHDIISSVWYIGKKYGIDREHSERVKELALKIFDKTKVFHRLSDRERLFLEVSSILHDVGKYVNLNEDGFYCYNIIYYEEILGFSDKNLNIVANVVRYHGEEIPSLSHENYKTLNFTDKIIVSKLAAILKLAEALNISKKNKISNISITIEDRILYFNLDTYRDCTLEMWSFKNNAEFFEEVMGVRPVIKIEASS
ncbi:exopolyphosphatase [Clostridium pasteurianum DSM 525 = ATCC 6013]|uniref:Exopolyphosphatase n=1 Tax=Clostridium pasteurianum DSM 525 = ATCC 6013 TaxID=1262449 RepID=A0A0H3J465_CLOPA|nr:HD domain-containing protein [Clostridium pasteurianum]AJA47652.1 exopolyphosphatase [Clostridium pasteurianum DSM 525 = ATCC 6013]AJA51640.1 exopolyphosphatase [Clostridium pasteurianum DSM 525 = ATCC 6013]AOZ74959.1 exopolyphosphatase [Clostridium pasteurianum DSM 525 = ATCC 6013]AOZ78754.1 exopolyphosphatase [Clostridium pasteurianum]ELP58009.1 ppx1 [Clostridium pasteurianum DSM 525 = ATCC 6013]